MNREGQGMKRAAGGMALSVLVLFVAGCSNPMKWWSGPEERPSQRLAGATLYQCAGDKQLAVRYAAQGQAMVLLPEREFRLDQTTSASGVRYTNGRTTLLTQGDETQLEENGSLLFAACKRTASR